MTQDLKIRLATPEDAQQIALHRRLMFASMHPYPPEDLAKMEAFYVGWVADKIAEESYLGWLIETEDGEIVGGAGLWIHEWCMSPMLMDDKKGHIIDVYVAPEYREQGLARKLMEILLDWCKENDLIRVTLNASNAGRHLYETMGFKQDNMMSVGINKLRGL